MLSSLALSLALASFVTAQDTTSATGSTTFDENTIPTILPTISNISNIVTISGTLTPTDTLIPTEAPLQTTTATVGGSVTVFACIAATDQIISIQTDTALGNEPAPTPICGEGVPTTVLTVRPPPVINSTVTASLNGTSLSMTATLTATESTTTTGTGTGGALESGSTSTPSTQSGNPAPTMAVAGGLAGIVGLAAGMVFL